MDQEHLIQLASFNLASVHARSHVFLGTLLWQGNAGQTIAVQTSFKRLLGIENTLRLMICIAYRLLSTTITSSGRIGRPWHHVWLGQE